MLRRLRAFVGAKKRPSRIRHLRRALFVLGVRAAFRVILTKRSGVYFAQVLRSAAQEIALLRKTFALLHFKSRLLALHALGVASMASRMLAGQIAATGALHAGHRTRCSLA